MMRLKLLISKTMLLLVFACSSAPEATSDEVDLTRLPIGDGKISNGPEAGSVWSCSTQFRIPGPNSKVGDWFKDDGTFDMTAKPIVEGEVLWPSDISIVRDGDRRVLTSNLLPDHPTGEYPIAPDSEPYKYDHNPNAIEEQDVLASFPALPEFADQPSCLSMGPIGVMLSGASIFNSLDDAGKDAVAHEIQDSCQGHPMGTGVYHYHSLSLCQEGNEKGDDHSPLVGYALDGFGIYGHLGKAGKVLTNEDLDACHGHTHSIEWDGDERTLYHYHATWEYPYTLGCFMGTPATLEGLRENDNPNRNRRR